MKNRAVIALIATVGGIVGGFVLAELIGILGFLLFGKAVGVKYLPIILPVLGAVVALIFTSIWKPSKAHDK
ncbi:hypothetical protein D3P07_24210 [Paenibacillus sp. 1011MAR3C5]|uniref:DUF5957 family protein n=1 Tax=Paenibacillus sp. 1011MAR3C5 TaxID=1675787 RepID=UPI000E6CFF3A|nr:DUF5957 family protein [Paenibacillus sp. 1011MAR3C5]RJE83918.1 hypothetical protein D3P07_24210 [Paenibacillus sp. 1011MAR3C5]